MAKKKTERKFGRVAYGLRAPIIREGDDIRKIAVDTLLNSGISIRDKGVYAITESVVARATGLYATVDEIAADVRKKFVNEEGKFGHLVLWYPVYSRNRFAICLKGIARAMDRGATLFIAVSPKDEVGNKLVNQVTGVDIIKYYTEICEAEGVKVSFWGKDDGEYKKLHSKLVRLENHLVCPVRDNEEIMDALDLAKATIDDDGAYNCYSLADILKEKSEWGLYGSNKSSEEKIKLFPPTDLCMNLVNGVVEDIKAATGKTIYAIVFGDGCFLDNDSQINECLDPTPAPGYSPELANMPSEVKIKNLADDKYKDLSGEELAKALKKEAKEAGDTAGKMISLGCTPRHMYNILPTLFDMLVGSGSQGCPFGYCDGYFDNYGDD